MERRLKFGILGYGRFAERAIGPAIRESHRAEFVALQKRSLPEAKEKARDVGVPFAFDTVADLVRCPDVEAVFIVSVNSAHCPETVAAAEAGKHVLVEKPMALTVAEAERMIDACRKNHVKLSVGHMVRLSPAIRRVRELIVSGRYGPVSFARADFSYNGKQSHRPWLRDMRTAGGGPLFDIGVHCLDTLRYLVGDEIASIRAHLEPLPTAETTESTANLSLRFSRGTLGSVYCSYESSVRRRYLEVVCRDAVISVPEFTANNEKLAVNIVKGNGDLPSDRATEKFGGVNLYAREIDLFAEAILNDGEYELTGENGLRNMRILEETLRVARQD